MYTQETLTSGVRDYYNKKQNDRNFRLSAESGIINHHFGIGRFDETVVATQDQIAAELNRLELNQIDALISHMEPILPQHRVLDAGCGRGGTAFMVSQRFGVPVDGITISSYQKEFAESLARARGWDKLVTIHLMDYLHQKFQDSTFDHVITNETTHYALTLEPLFREFARVLKAGGKYTIATWCINQRQDNPYIDPINAHYGVEMHTRQEYVDALAASGFTNITVSDMTEPATPYWDLRRSWDEKSGIEDAFYNGHKENKILYLFITAEKR